MQGRFVLEGSQIVGFRFRLETEQRELVLRSERYRTRVDAVQGVDITRQFAGNSRNFERRGNREDGFSFVLRSPRGSLVATGATHRSEAARDGAIAFAVLHAQDAALADHAAERTPVLARQGR